MTPLTLIKTIGTIGASVVIYFSSVIAPNYSNAILIHLADIVNGSVTNTTIAANAPNWAFATPLATPQVGTIATSSHANAASGLASSTPYTFQVAALDSFGTTTVSSPVTITTDASTTQSTPEDIILKWSPVPGATGYAVYFGTTSSQTSTLSQYFLATTSSQYDFSTSTASKAGSNVFADTHAFSSFLSPFGPSWLNGNSGSATSSAVASTTGLQIGGTVVPRASATTTACEADTNGSIFYNEANSHIWGCTGSTWGKIL